MRAPADIVVIGAGVLGAAVSYRLAQMGADVTVLESGQPGSGTSGATFAVDVSPWKTPRAFFELNLAAGHEHRALAREIEPSPWLHPAGILEWGTGEEHRQAVRVRVDRLRGWGYPAEWLAPRRVHELEPELVLSLERASEVVHYPEAAWYEPVAMAETLLRRAVDLGAVVHRGEPVTRMTTAKNRVRALETASGRRIGAEWVVNCAGPGAGAVAALSGVDLPLLRLPGLVVTLEPRAETLRGIVAAPEVHLRRGAGGRLVVHSWAVDAKLARAGTQSPDEVLVRELLTRARAVAPRLASAPVERARIGVRPIPPDGLPIVGPMPGVRNLYSLVSHSAVHLAPVLGRLAAREIVRRQAEPRLAPFRPERLFEADLAIADESLRRMTSQLPIGRAAGSRS